MGKGRSRRQDVFILTETNSIAGDRFETEVGYAVSPETVEAWALDRNQQGIDEETGNIVQTLSERSYKPLVVFDLDSEDSSKLAVKNVNTISSQQEDEEMALMERKKSKQSMLLWIGIVATIFALTISIMVLQGLI